ncbi:peptidoglycan editing factor PgeF [Bacillus horti]|uniref:Purine nucleoside phosphorylase n=1 Tax=Caldalkalibacillus horti TaxID=77523 RepID=A0ABT9VUG3_9BACI|nr:peptidoglycan editing factor PgeF [Bacillus horti]MDQ0164621.1 YfiH family protein [Bacillus horti]
MKSEPFAYLPDQSEDLLIVSWMNAFPWLTVGFTTKLGGVSKGEYSSQNHGLHVGDENESVIQNRELLASRLSFSFEAWTSANQIHGTNIYEVKSTDRGKGRDHLDTEIDKVDGLYTKQRDILLASFYADCVPLFFLDPVKQLVGIAHAGWKGTAKQIGAELIEAWVSEQGSKREDIQVAVGPAIGQCCYEVSEDVVTHFQDFSSTHAIQESDSFGKYRIDLKQINVQFLLQAGILPKHIEVSSWCTSCNQNLFFSHRRDQGRTGRMVAFIAKKGE